MFNISCPFWTLGALQAVKILFMINNDYGIEYEHLIEFVIGVNVRRNPSFSI